MPEGNQFYIGDYIVLPAHNKIIYFEHEFSVEPKIMAVLAYFVKHPNEVLSKNQIIEGLWPNQTFGQEVITRAVFELRKIFKDDAKQPKFISTVNRKGYSFIHDVAFENTTKPAIKEDAGIARPKVDARYLKALLFFVVVALLSYIVIYISNSEEHYVPEQTSLLSNEFDNSYHPAFSPDGTRYVYIAQQANKYAIIQTALENRQQTRLYESTARLVSPTMLTSESIVFGRCDASACDIVKHNLINSAQITFELAPNIGVIQNIVKLDIDSSKRYVALETTSNGQRLVKLLSLNNDTLSEFKRLDSARLPSFDSDHDRLFYVALSDAGHEEIYQYDIATDRHEKFAIAFDRMFSIEVKAAGKLLLSGRRNGESGVWLFDVASKKLQKTIDALPGYVFTDLTSHYGTKQLIYKSIKRNIDIGLTGFDSDFTGINSDMIDMNAVYVEQHHQLVFASNRTGFYELWRHRDGRLEMLTQLRANVIERPIISNAQGKIAFTSSRLNKAYLRVIALESGEIVNEYKMPYKGHLLSWSQDDSSVYFSANVNEQYTIFEFNLQSQSITPVSLNAGVLYAVDSENNEYYGNMLTAQLMKRTLNGEVKSLLQLPFSAIPIMPHQAKLINDRLYFVDNEKGTRVVKSYALMGADIKREIELPANAYVTQLGLTGNIFAIYDQLVADEKKFVLTQFTDKRQ